MPQRLIVGVLLALSGFAALVLQVGWLREFRLVFGSSTAASAAVLAIFMGGIGLGNAWLGRRADQQANPLRWYAWLLLGIAVTSALSPWLIEGMRGAYIALGGQSSLGPLGATAVRLALAAAVLAAPTILMGGTLPAAASAAIGHDDRARRGVGVLYGLNELGAVLGAALSTLLLLEWLGTRSTLLLAAGVDLLAGLAALALSQSAASWKTPAAAVNDPVPLAAENASATRAERGGLYATAAVLGFAFLLMEIVWYRMLAPLMGGSTYTFGIILAVVLAGIAIGGWTYALLLRGWQPSWSALAVTCALEALCLAIPFALGDRLAVGAAAILELKAFGFGGAVVAWSLIAAVVVLPAAIVSGVQFPLLVAMLGQGDRQVGRQLGGAFAWNTLGAIAGSLAGGFGLLPLLTAPGAWRLAVVLLAATSALVTLLPIRSGRRWRTAIPALAIGAGAIVAICAVGPTAVWRHSGIGAGRFALLDHSPNVLHDHMNGMRRVTIWEADGVESSVALVADNGLAFYVNGKSDGNAVDDAGTQVMLPLVGGLLHPDPRRVLVVGLGTGESAGWLADVESVERVDVVELEPAIVEVARACAAANRQVLDNPKANLIFDDARELLLTTGQHYDLIVSEPSNPYRSGIASLFTHEFYEAVAGRLNDRGLFLQWVQTYEIDARTIRTAICTLRSVFAHVELWQTRSGDTVFVCSGQPIDHDAAQLRERIAREPYRSALVDAWQVSDLEGVLAHYLAGGKLLDAVIDSAPPEINTDDRNQIEYGLARTLGRRNLFSLSGLRQAAARLGNDRPQLSGEVDWDRVIEQRLFQQLFAGEELPAELQRTPNEHARLTALQYFRLGRMAEATTAWESQPLPPQGVAELTMLAQAYAEQGSPRAQLLLPSLNALRPTAARLVEATLAARSGDPDLAAALLIEAFVRLRTDPWPEPLAQAGLNLAGELGATDARRARRLRAVLEEPFAVRLLDSQRSATKLRLSAVMPATLRATDFADYEPFVPWTRDFLTARAAVYAAAEHPLAPQAARDLAAFLRAADETALLPAESANSTTP